MKFIYNLIISIIAISFSLSLFSQENNPQDGLIQIGDLLWDHKPDRTGLDWDDAVSYCLNRKMRLPSKEELLKHEVELNKLENDSFVHDKNGGPYYAVDRLYWTSTESDKYPSMIWVIRIRRIPDEKIEGGPVRKSFRGGNTRCVKEAEKK